MTDVKTAIDISTKGAEQFVEMYYKVVDSQRNLIGRLYRESSAVLWNGNVITGTTALQEFYSKMPITLHEIQALDCQPLLGTLNNAGTFSILINVSGAVKYADDAHPRPFAQTFILAPDLEKGSNYFVNNDNFRFV